MKIDIGKIGSIPLIIAGILFSYSFGCVGILLAGFTPSIQIIQDTLFVEIPLILICLGIWLPRSRITLYAGRIGTILWLLPMSVYTLIIFGEFEHASPRSLIEYTIIVLSTVLTALSLWKSIEPEEVEK